MEIVPDSTTPPPTPVPHCWVWLWFSISLWPLWTQCIRLSGPGTRPSYLQQFLAGFPVSAYCPWLHFSAHILHLLSPWAPLLAWAHQLAQPALSNLRRQLGVCRRASTSVLSLPSCPLPNPAPIMNLWPKHLWHIFSFPSFRTEQTYRVVLVLVKIKMQLL